MQPIRLFIAGWIAYRQVGDYMTDNSSSNNDQKIKFSKFEDQYDITPKAIEANWADIVDLFSEHRVFNGDKTQEMHFNGCEFNGDRRQDNVVAMHMLVLDYDDGLPIDEAQKLFSEYEHIGYTSYNHQVPKNGKPPVDKYRVIIPLVTPCPMKDWMEIRHNVETFAPQVDMASVKLSQPFAVPLVRTNGGKIAWHNEGKWLDVSDWERQNQFDPTNYTNYTPSTPDNEVDEDFIFETKKGSVRFGDVDTRISDVLCPFHNEDSPYGTFLNKQGGSVYHVCRKCGTTKLGQSNHHEDDKPDSVITDFVATRKKKKKPQPKKKNFTKQDHLDDMIGVGETVAEPFSKEKRAELIKKHCLRPRKNMLLYAFEGFGKSYLTVLWARDHGKKVLFGCNSNLQAREQAAGFEKQGCKVQVILSREHRLETEYQVEIVRNEPVNPWEQGKVKIGTTKTNMIKTGMA
jgi:hypothetical protein